MADLEKTQDDETQDPQKMHVPTSKYNTKDRDLEATLPSSQSILGQTYGVTRDDQPLHPPRQVTSNSLRQARSATSLRSGSYAPSYSHTGHNGPLVNVDGANGDQASVAEELAWGPSHPCFPHLNPHVPMKSREYSDTRVIRIRRDWMVKGDLAPTYSNVYPEILDPLLPEQEFRNIIQNINQTLIDAFDPFATWNWIDGLLGLATGWLWEDFRPRGVKGKLRNLETWIQEWNNKVGSRDGVRIIPLRRTAYMNLDIQIPDPVVQAVKEEDDSRPVTSDGPKP